MARAATAYIALGARLIAMLHQLLFLHAQHRFMAALRKARGQLIGVLIGSFLRPPPRRLVPLPPSALLQEVDDHAEHPAAIAKGAKIFNGHSGIWHLH